MSIWWMSPGEDHLRPLARARDDRLHLVGGEVLGLVHDEEDVVERAAADVGERRDADLLVLDHLRERLVLAALPGEAVADHGEVVPQRLHVGVELALDVAGEEADVAVPQRHDGAREVDLVVAPALLEGGGQRQERLAGAGAAGQRDELDLGAHQGVEREDLLGVARLDAVGRALDDALERPLAAVVVRQRAEAAVLHDEVLVRVELGSGPPNGTSATGRVWGSLCRRAIASLGRPSKQAVPV